MSVYRCYSKKKEGFDVEAQGLCKQLREQLGIHTLHFMIMTIVMTMVAQVSPPFGVVLFAMTGTFREKIETVIKGALPFIAVLSIACLVVIFFPQISTCVVNWLLY